MNRAIRGSVINGDESVSPTSTTAAAGATVESADQATSQVADQAPSRPADKSKHEPAFTPPQDAPAVPYDEHHGKGGMYALVDGKRVPADEDGTPKSKK